MKNKKVVACIIARTVSTRLPLKVLRDLFPHTSMLDFLIQNIKSSTVCDEIYICTSIEAVDDVLEDVALRNNIKIYRGSPDEITERLIAVGEKENADVLIRITGDNPFTASNLIEHQVRFLSDENLDYVRVTDLPVGATSEVFTFDALKRCNEMIDPKVSEYLMLFFFEPKNFRTGVIKISETDYSNFSLTVDTPGDLVRTKKIVLHLGMKETFKKFELNQILDIILDEEKDIPEKIIEPAGKVKLPYDEIVSYGTFKKDMQRRIDESETLKLYE